MKNPVISVIVPVYNVEKYLRKCLDSILKQTFSNIEIICVNDGSTDKSRKILEEYKNKDSRIIIVDKKNGGLSSARNAGMKVAKGEFYSFIDSDDWIDETMLEKLYNNATLYSSDISICAVHQYDESKQMIDDSNPYYTLDYFDESFDNRAFSYKDTKPFLMDVCVMAWNKLYRKSFVDSLGAIFPDGLIFEDGPFFFKIFFKTNKISIVRDCLYYYRINRKNSIIQKAGKKYINLVDVIELMYKEINKIPDFEDVKYLFFTKKVEDLIYRYENTIFKYKIEFAKKIKNESSLLNENLFPPIKAKGYFKYHYYLLKQLKNGNSFIFEIHKMRIKTMFKIMQIMYFTESFYTFKYKTHMFKIKKNPNIFDIYYKNDKLYINLFKKINFTIPFKYSELEKLYQDD